MPLEFYLIVLGLLVGGVFLGIYIYRKTRPLAEKLSDLAVSAEQNPTNLEGLELKVESIVDSALNSIDRLDSDADEHRESSGEETFEDLAAALSTEEDYEETFEDLAAALSTEEDHMAEDEVERVPVSKAANLLCVVNILTALILFVVFIWEDLTAGYGFKEAFDGVFWTTLVVSPLFVVQWIEYQFFKIRRNGYDSIWIYGVEGLLGAFLAVVVYFVATMGPSEVWDYFLGVWVALVFIAWGWQQLFPNSALSKMLPNFSSSNKRGAAIASWLKGGESTSHNRSISRKISNSTSTPSFSNSPKTKQKEKKMPTPTQTTASRNIFEVYILTGTGGFPQLAGSFPTLTHAEWRADDLRKRGYKARVVQKQGGPVN